MTRQDFDFYETPQPVVAALLEASPIPTRWVWDVGAGSGAITKVLVDYGYCVRAIEIQSKFLNSLDEAGARLVHVGHEFGDWLSLPLRVDLLHAQIKIENNNCIPFSIIANPPFSHDLEFVRGALELGPRYVAMLLKVSFFSSLKRAALHERWPVTNFHPLVPRPGFTGKGTDKYDLGWFVWDTSQKPMSYKILNWRD